MDTTQTTASSLTIEALYTQYADLLMHYFMAHGWSYEDAEDLTHDTFLKAWKAFPFVVCRNPLSWLYAIGRNTGIDAWRTQRRREYAPLDGVEESRTDGGEQEERIVTRLAVEEALQRLSRRSRRAVLLFASGYSLDEIAALVNHSSTAIKMTVYRGRKAVKQLVEEGMQ